MKKTIVMLGSVMLLAASSCQKEKSTMPSKLDNTTNVSLTNAGLYSFGTESKKDGKPCASPAGNCVVLDTVVITPGKLTKITFNLMSSAEVGQFWKSNDMALACQLRPQIAVQKLQSGEYYMSCNYEDSNVINYYVGRTANPTFTNSEFVVQFKK